ncbi:DNA alkylation repair protein [Andreprevotia chitinilytica]|uniref:DNA alkylation repair protein n=1 Tax=Andreprevotia chitinilytica TaxID=396808 RepID=UPI0005534643|nr:DNA alkylation repair protein [Andreprevotia chitinilytica]
MADVTDWLARFQTALSPAADPAGATAMAAYMRGHFAYLGVATPLRRQLTKTLVREARSSLDEVTLLNLCDALWRESQREYQYAACDLLDACSKSLTPAALPRLEALVTSKSWWDTVDDLAGDIIGGLVLRHRALVPRMDELVRHPDLWLRRTAILYQLGWKTETDQPRLFAACLANAADPDFFIRKAIGWGLRQYARVAPDEVRNFLLVHRNVLSPLSVREAGKHLG